MVFGLTCKSLENSELYCTVWTLSTSTDGWMINGHKGVTALRSVYLSIYFWKLLHGAPVDPIYGITGINRVFWIWICISINRVQKTGKLCCSGLRSVNQLIDLFVYLAQQSSIFNSIQEISKYLLKQAMTKKFFNFHTLYRLLCKHRWEDVLITEN